MFWKQNRALYFFFFSIVFFNWGKKRNFTSGYEDVSCFLSEVYCVYLLCWGLASSQFNFWFGVRPDCGPVLAWGSGVFTWPFLLTGPGLWLSSCETSENMIFRGFLFLPFSHQASYTPSSGNTLKGNLIVYHRAPVSWWQILCPQILSSCWDKRWEQLLESDHLSEDVFIPLPAPQQLSTAFRQMISAFNWTFLVLLDRRTDLFGAGYSISVTIMDIFLL